MHSYQGDVESSNLIPKQLFRQIWIGLTERFTYCFPFVMFGMITLELSPDGFASLY